MHARINLIPDKTKVIHDENSLTLKKWLRINVIPLLRNKNKILTKKVIVHI